MSTNSITRFASAIIGFAALAPLLTQTVRAEITDYISVERIATGLDQPVYVTAPAGDMDRLFVVEQGGVIRIVDLESGGMNPTPFLVVPGLATGNEQGLLGLAFHPDYAANGFFYVDYTESGTGATRIVRFRVSATDANVADPASANAVLGIAQPQSNHNGGWLGFGPDGHLYISSGDGGGSNDDDAGHTPGIGNAQDITDNLLGKMLRIDVDGDDFPLDAERNYAIPPDNPFVGVSGDDEIWAYGLRNPWRASFDRLTGDLYIGDVGQNTREEIDFQGAASSGGENYGWRLREGTIQTPGSVGGPPPLGAVEPIYDYLHGNGTFQGNSVTGGYRYRGPILPLRGRYVFGDYFRKFWSFDPSGDPASDVESWTDLLAPDIGQIDNVSSFGEDAAGNLYIVDHGGDIFALRPVCSLELSLTHGAQGLTLDFGLESGVPSTWTVVLLAGGGFFPLWSVPLPALPFTPFSLTLPGVTGFGIVGVLGVFSTADGLICADLGFVYTGPAP